MVYSYHSKCEISCKYLTLLFCENTSNAIISSNSCWGHWSVKGNISFSKSPYQWLLKTWSWICFTKTKQSKKNASIWIPGLTYMCVYCTAAENWIVRILAGENSERFTRNPTLSTIGIHHIPIFTMGSRNSYHGDLEFTLGQFCCLLSMIQSFYSTLNIR